MIEAHLIENLTIDRQDFDTLPVFARQGGLSQATRIFGPRLDEMIIALNEAIAA
jgi:type I restriction enzyme R subunit